MTEDLSQDEMTRILVEMARNSRSETARIQAIKELRAMRRDRPAAPPREGDGLYEVSNPGRIRKAN